MLKIDLITGDPGEGRASYTPDCPEHRHLGSPPGGVDRVLVVVVPKPQAVGAGSGSVGGRGTTTLRAA